MYSFCVVESVYELQKKQISESFSCYLISAKQKNINRQVMQSD